MLTIAECRRILGKRFQNYTDKQIEMIREWLYKLANMDKEKRNNKIIQ